MKATAAMLVIVLAGCSATRELQRRSANGRRRWPDVGM